LKYVGIIETPCDRQYDVRNVEVEAPGYRAAWAQVNAQCDESEGAREFVRGVVEVER